MVSNSGRKSKKVRLGNGAKAGSIKSHSSAGGSVLSGEAIDKTTKVELSQTVIKEEPIEWPEIRRLRSRTVAQQPTTAPGYGSKPECERGTTSGHSQNMVRVKSHSDDPEMRELKSRVVSILPVVLPEFRKLSKFTYGSNSLVSEPMVKEEPDWEESKKRELKNSAVPRPPPNTPASQENKECSNGRRKVLAEQIGKQIPCTEPQTRELRSRTVIIFPVTPLTRKKKECADNSVSALTEHAATQHANTEPQPRILRSRTAATPYADTPKSRGKSLLKKDNKPCLSKRVAEEKRDSVKPSKRKAKCRTALNERRSRDRLNPLMKKSKSSRVKVTKLTVTSASRKKAELNKKPKKKLEKRTIKKGKPSPRPVKKNKPAPSSEKKRSHGERSVTTSKNKLTVARNTSNHGTLCREKNTSWPKNNNSTIMQYNNNSIMHYETLRKQVLPHLSIEDGFMEKYGRGAFRQPVSSGFDDVPVYVREINRTFYANHMIQRRFYAEEVVPCDSLTEEQFEELRKQGFELATLQVPDTLTPTQQYAARDVIAHYQSKHSNRRVLKY